MIYVIIILAPAIPFLAMLFVKLYQDYQARKMAGEYHASLKQRRNEQEEEELLELISDLEIESEQIVQYHGTLQ